MFSGKIYVESDLYWLKSEWMALTAAVLTWEGAGKSGKPSARLMALRLWARNDSSWIGEDVSFFAADDNFPSIVLFPLVFKPLFRSFLQNPWSPLCSVELRPSSNADGLSCNVVNVVDTCFFFGKLNVVYFDVMLLSFLNKMLVTLYTVYFLSYYFQFQIESTWVSYARANKKNE